MRSVFEKEIKHRRPVRGACVFGRLRDAAYLDRIRSFRTLCDFKGQLVTFAQFVVLNADELVGVEKEIFFLAIALDEPESLRGKTGNSSFLHVDVREKVGNTSTAGGSPEDSKP